MFRLRLLAIICCSGCFLLSYATEQTGIPATTEFGFEFGSEFVETGNMQFRQPNIRVNVSQRFLNAAVNNTTRESAPVNEVLLGTCYTGNSVTDTYLSLRTLPSETNIALALDLTATVAAQTNALSRRVVVSSCSCTNILATKELRLEDRGWLTRPAFAMATTRSKITDISMNRLFGYQIAKRKAFQQRGAVGREVASRAAARTRFEFDHRVHHMVNTMQHDFDRRMRTILDPLPPIVGRRSTSQGIEMSLLQANRQQLGAQTQPPPEPWGNSSDLFVRMHQSAVNNRLAETLAGKKLDEDEIAQLAARFFGSKTELVESEKSKETWSIQFDSVRPLAVEFEAGKVTLTLRAKNITIGEKSIPPTQVTVSYALHVSDGKITGVREGKIQIAPTDSDARASVGLRYQVLRSTLRKRFARLLPTNFDWANLLPEFGELPASLTLRIDHCQLEDQWLAIDYRLSTRQAIAF